MKSHVLLLGLTCVFCTPRTVKHLPVRLGRFQATSEDAAHDLCAPLCVKHHPLRLSNLHSVFKGMAEPNDGKYSDRDRMLKALLMSADVDAEILSDYLSEDEVSILKTFGKNHGYDYEARGGKGIASKEKEIVLEQGSVIQQQQQQENEIVMADAYDKKVPHVCADEGHTCVCIGTVYYGRKYKSGTPGSGATTTLAQLRSQEHKRKAVTGSILCSYNFMGGDPLPRYFKYCYCDPMQAKDAFTVGEIVQRRDKGQEWNWGRVTSVSPLKVTLGNDANVNGYSWDEVRKAPKAPNMLPDISRSDESPAMITSGRPIYELPKGATTRKTALKSGSQSQEIKDAEDIAYASLSLPDDAHQAQKEKNDRLGNSSKLSEHPPASEQTLLDFARSSNGTEQTGANTAAQNENKTPQTVAPDWGAMAQASLNEYSTASERILLDSVRDASGIDQTSAKTATQHEKEAPQTAAPDLVSTAKVSGEQTKAASIAEKKPTSPTGTIRGASDEAQIYAVSSLHRLAKKTQDHNAISEGGGVRSLIEALREDNSQVQEEATAALWKLSREDTGRDAIIKEGGLQPLIKILWEGSPLAQSNAVPIFTNLATMEQNHGLIRLEGGIQPLIKLMREGSHRAQRRALRAICNLATTVQNAELIRDVGGIPGLIKFLREDSHEDRDTAAFALSSLSESSASAKAIREEGGIPPLIQLLRGDNLPETQEAAATTLANLAMSVQNQDSIREAGGVYPLILLLKTGTKQARAKAVITLRQFVKLERNKRVMREIPGLLKALMDILYGSREEGLVKSYARMTIGQLHRHGDEVPFNTEEAVEIMTALKRGDPLPSIDQTSLPAKFLQVDLSTWLNLLTFLSIIAVGACVLISTSSTLSVSISSRLLRPILLT